MVDIDLVNIRQVNNLSSRKCKRYVGMMFASMVISFSLGLGATATAVPQLNEVTVFGTGERKHLSNGVSGNDVIELNQKTDIDPGKEEELVSDISLISSGELVIEKGHNNGLYASYNDIGNIRSMVIMAEKLVIRSTWKLRGTNVTIHAKELVFEGDGQINTSPDGNGVPASRPADTFSGADGLDAGSVTLWADTVVNNPSKHSFDMTGGKGQDAGKGQNGVDGASMSIVLPRSVRAFWDEHGHSYTLKPGEECVYYDGNKGADIAGVADMPGDGTNAKPPGTPGKGGDGGAFKSNESSDSMSYSSQGGAAGYPGSVGDGGTGSYAYNGGTGGEPRLAVWIHLSGDYTASTGDVSVAKRRASLNGASHWAPSGKKGTAGNFERVGNKYLWLNPQLLREILNTVKDNYLQNDIATATDKLTEYSTIIEDYRASDDWDQAETTDMVRFELSQMYDEMQLLLQQITNGQDYFGNSNGWVPLLSFEVLSKVFKEEIDQSLNMIYLAKWITEKQEDSALTIAALKTVRKNLNTEIDKAKTKYDKDLSALSALTGESIVMEGRVKTLQSQLKFIDTDLRQQAKNNTETPDWEVGLRVGLKVAGSICEMVPVYQPALGAAGGALNLAGDFDSDEPWETVTGAIGLGEKYLESGIQAAATEQETNKNSVDTSNKATRLNSLKNLSQAAQSLSAGIKGISATLQKAKAPQSEIEAELNKLRSFDPQYKAVVDDISQLLKDKGVFADEIAAATQDITAGSNLITRNILAIEALDITAGSQRDVIDSRVNSYLKDMERRAFDRLLKYHYYMAKAYEYRLVKAYTGTLDLEGLFNKILDVVAGKEGDTVGGALTTGQRDLIKTVYLDVIASTSQSILTDYNESPSSAGSSRTFTLNQQQLDTLNRGEKLNFNLRDDVPTLFTSNEENLRIVDLAVDSMTTELVNGGEYLSPSFVKLTIEHSGISNLKKDGNVFRFRQYNSNTLNPITWVSQYEPENNTITPTSPKAAADSLIMSLVPGLDASQQLLYSRPSAWADLTFSIDGVNGPESFGPDNDEPPVLITELKLRLNFDQTIRTVNVSEVGIVARSDTGEKLSPLFSVSEPDSNERAEGQGDILRIYELDNTTVQITAQQRFGAYVFSKWTENNKDYGDDPTNPIATVKNDDDYRLIALYVIAPPEIVSPLDAITFYGSYFEYQIMVSSHGATSFEASGLPSGLSLDPSTGIISGEVAFTGTYNIELTATNTGGKRYATLMLSPSQPVSSTADTGPGSLRDKIAAMPAGATISFASSFSIELNSPLIISKNLTIDASDIPSGVVISGKELVRVMEISPDVEVTLKGIIIANGNAGDIEYGGGILNNGILTLVDVILDNNTARLGGALFNSDNSTLTVLTSTLSNNNAHMGGAIFNNGDLTMADSILFDNLAGSEGGAIYNVSSMILTNTTVTGNEAKYGGGLANESSATIIHSTFADNNGIDTSGGIDNYSASANLIVENSIIANNTSGSANNIGNYDGSITFNGNNLLGDNLTLDINADNVLIGTADSPIDPLLAPRGDYGGPTQTMPPLPSSPAVNAGVLLSSTLASDQQGNPRPSGIQPDLGAVELQQVDVNDIDGDGIANADDVFPSIAIGDYLDTDNDGAPDECGESCVALGMAADADDDNDGYDDVLELESGTNPLDANDIPLTTTPRSRLLNLILIKAALDAKVEQ
jgi:hypothetical protein